MATSRVRRVLSGIRRLHVALTIGLPINHELHLANLNITRNLAVESRASSSVQQRTHGQDHTALLPKTRRMWTWVAAHTTLTSRIPTLSPANTPCTLYLLW